MKKWLKPALPIVALTITAGACGSTGDPEAGLEGSQGGAGSGTGGSAGTSGSAGSGAAPDASNDAFLDASTLDNGCPGDVQSFIWIANTAEGTVSKVCTVNGVEVARYVTSEAAEVGDPSRTSVNRHGDVVVTNRSPKTGPSSVTKFAADMKDCVDRNKDGVITTSHGPKDVLPFGQDECMIWNSKLPSAAGIGARATAWDGEEDEKTGVGGHVWIGALDTSQVFQLDGTTGKVLKQGPAPVQPYGGVIDGKGSFWVVAATCTVGLCSIARVDMKTLQTKAFPVTCGYGISVDTTGRIWTSGLGCVNRFDPATETNKSLQVAGFNRGIAVDGTGGVWAANSNGDMVHVNEADVTLVKRFAVGVPDMIGIAVDFEGFVWGVSQGGNETYKVDPKTHTLVAKVPIGVGPYTYSDMTGMQLRNVVPVK